MDRASRFSFNSKLVRLKAPKRAGGAECEEEFQFQTGAIKSEGVPPAGDVHRVRFNSKLVRLKGVLLFNQRQMPYSVSIPNWCD